MIDVALLGTGGMIPFKNRYLASFACRVNGDIILIDCGEGTQMAFESTEWSYKDIKVICISHFHADHVAGIPGMLLRMSNYGKDDKLTIIGPKGIGSVVNSLRVIAPALAFDIEYVEMKYSKGNINKNVYTEIKGLNISSIGLDHGMPCFGFKIELDRLPKFDLERAKKLNIPVKYWNSLQHGEIVKYDNKQYTPDMVMGDKRKGISVTYMTDTRPIYQMKDFANSSDLLVLEAMHGNVDEIEKSKEKMHMHLSESLKIAQISSVKELWLTHYSPSLMNPDFYEIACKKVFKNSVIGKDGMMKTLMFEE